jgi:hypothetical protein
MMKWRHQLNQKANTHSRIWIFDDLPYVGQYGFILGHFGRSTVQRILVQRTDATIASVLRVDSIHRSHLIAGHRSVEAQLGLTGTAVVLDTGIKLGSHINDGVLPKVIG